MYIIHPSICVAEKNLRLSEFIWWGQPLQNSPTDFLWTTIINARNVVLGIATTVFTELNEGDVAIGIVVDITVAEEKRIIEVVMVLGLVCCNQGCIDLPIIIDWY